MDNKLIYIPIMINKFYLLYIKIIVWKVWTSLKYLSQRMIERVYKVMVISNIYSPMSSPFPDLPWTYPSTIEKLLLFYMQCFCHKINFWGDNFFPMTCSLIRIKNFRRLLLNIAGITKTVHCPIFPPFILIYWRGNFVCHHRGCRSIYFIPKTPYLNLHEPTILYAIFLVCILV